MNVLYCPADGLVGDVVPFYWQGKYHVFYLKASLPPAANRLIRIPWAHAVSTDLVHWEEWPTVIEPGSDGEPDFMGCWTGSVIERQGVFHIFYTSIAGPGMPETICHATSQDLRHWEKDPRNPILRADPELYEHGYWRDPYVFWNEDEGEYWMLLGAREKSGPSNRRGCTGLATSPDLVSWRICPPFWSPRLYFSHECPDLFQWGDNWVLVFSTLFSDATLTRYRMSKSLRGPWIAPANDTFDDRALYAAKTISDGKRRFIMGWNSQSLSEPSWTPNRDGGVDTGVFEWGGHLVVHELSTADNGAIAVHLPSEIEGIFATAKPLSFKPLFGRWESDSHSLNSGYSDGFSAGLLGELPETCLIELILELQTHVRACGLLLWTDPSLDEYYQLRWEPGRHRIVYDRWPRPSEKQFLLERPLEIPADEKLKLKLIIDGTALEVYLNDAIAFGARLYPGDKRAFGLFTVEGAAAFGNVTLRCV